MTNFNGSITSEKNPLSVSRGLNLHPCFIGMDSLYLVIEYPYRDMFDRWARVVEDFQDVRLHEGIAFNGLVVRRGLIGYKLSVWDCDARLLITDRVKETLVGSPSEGQGMGMMLQLGPKWLRRYGDKSIEELQGNVLGQLILFGIAGPEQYRIRVNRVDLAIDLLGLSVADFSTDEWRRNWIGYANKFDLT